MIVLDSVDSALAWRTSLAPQVRVGLVPTMGALHDGHARCIQSCSATSDVSVTSIFVNRSQFGDSHDFDSYPRTWESDLRVAEGAGASVIFAPGDDDMNQRMINHPRTAGPLSNLWEGEHRPGHFDAVVTVVNQLFAAIRPHRARFGEKDRQQLAVITSWAHNEWPAIAIDAEPTVREPDGLAMSSRNVRLSPDARRHAASIYAALSGLQREFNDGQRSSTRLIDNARSSISSEATIDYLTIVDAAKLTPLDHAKVGAVVLVAASIDGVRLIDNLTLSDKFLSMQRPV